MKEIKVLGTGCPKCKKLAENAEAAAKELGIDVELEKVTDINQIMGFGVMMTPALVVDGDVKSAGKVPSVENIKEIPYMDKQGDYFAIIGKNKWEEDISEFKAIIGQLRVGETYLPPHSAVFSFLKPTNKESMEKIVSCLEGVNISVYSKENYIDNVIHEIGHLFYREVF